MRVGASRIWEVIVIAAPVDSDLGAAAAAANVAVVVGVVVVVALCRRNLKLNKIPILPELPSRAEPHAS